MTARPLTGAAPNLPVPPVTYRTYLIVLGTVALMTQTIAALQPAPVRPAAPVTAAAPAPATLTAAGGVEAPPPAPPLASEVAATLAAPLPDATPYPPRVRHEAPCDTVTTTADICVAPPPEMELTAGAVIEDVLE